MENTSLTSAEHSLTVEMKPELTSTEQITIEDCKLFFFFVIVIMTYYHCLATQSHIQILKRMFFRVIIAVFVQVEVGDEGVVCGHGFRFRKVSCTDKHDAVLADNFCLQYMQGIFTVKCL